MGGFRVYETLLKAVEDVATHVASVRAFAGFPSDLRPCHVTPVLRDGCALLREDATVQSSAFPALHAAIIAAAPVMKWRETYPEGTARTAFMDRWGCFSIVGAGGPFASEQLRIFVVYMPPQLVYPWHNHPAEELYLVLGGAARFRARGRPDRVVSEGESVYHPQNLPHAIETQQSGMLSLVVWRTDLDAPPRLLSEAEALAPTASAQDSTTGARALRS